MLRTDINLAIVAMVEDPKTSDVINATEERYCYKEEEILPEVERHFGGTKLESFSINEQSENMNFSFSSPGTLQWSEDVQSYVLASFYWAYIISQIVGGLATQKLGTKRVFGYAQLATALCSLCIPWAAETHYGIVICLRSIQGFASVSCFLTCGGLYEPFLTKMATKCFTFFVFQIAYSFAFVP